jgi:GNAT superfamily N-acetyltransferase
MAADGFTFHVVPLRDVESGPAPIAVRALLGPGLAAELRANPDTTPATPCLFCLVDESGTPVSWIRLWADRLWLDGVELPWLWTGDLHTVPELRGRGLATHLQREGTRWAEQHGYGRGSVFSTDDTLHIYRKLQYLLPGYAGRHVLLRSARPVLAGHIGFKPVVTAAARSLHPFAAVAARVIRARCRRWTAGSKVWRRGDAAGAEVDAVIAAAERTMPLRFNISARKLQWKVDHASKKGGPCLVTVVAGEDGAPLALAVTRTRMETRPLAGRYRDFRCTTVLDFVCAEPSERTRQILLGHLVADFLDASDAEVMQLVSYDPRLAALSKTLGFLRAGRGMSYACRLPPGVTVPGPPQSIASWPVTHFSGDGPFF